MKGPTVLWVPSAEQELASISLSLSDRNRVMEAVHQIDTALKRDAVGESVALAEGLRAIERAPLRVIFEVHPDDAIVHVVVEQDARNRSAKPRGSGEPALKSRRRHGT